MRLRDQFIASVDTDVPVRRSVQQIQALVERFGASEFGVQYDANGAPSAVSFKVRDKRLGDPPMYMPVALHAPTETIYDALKDAGRSPWTTEAKQRHREQAARVAWRNLHDFVRASLIAVETGIMSLGEAFMANLVVTLPTGEAKRLGEIANAGGLLHSGRGGQLLLGKGD